jgi:hypothetical protein
VIIGEYLPRQSHGEYSPIITEPEANNCFSIFTQAFVFFETEFILILLISLSVNFHKTGSSQAPSPYSKHDYSYLYAMLQQNMMVAAILKIYILLYSPVGEYYTNNECL